MSQPNTFERYRLARIADITYSLLMARIQRRLCEGTRP